MDAALVLRAADVLRRGGLVAFPTETVYGLGADALNVGAVRRIFEVKGRPTSHPLIVHLGAASWLETWARDVPDSAHRLAARFWPGPLTLILKRSARVGDHVTGGQDTVGLRVPGHEIARALLSSFGSGIAAPSANRFGRVSPTTASHVRADLGDDVDLIIDGGTCDVGIESTIVDVTRGRPVVLRPGWITTTEIASTLGVSVSDADDASPRAPGTLEMHYAPRTPLEVVSERDLRARLRRWPRVAVLAFTAPDASADVAAFWLAPPDPAQYAHDLYAALRHLDAAHADAILVEEPPDAPPWAGIRDRLRRASRKKTPPSTLDRDTAAEKTQPE
jgi:L-threonylcarbamoyladenylate synthase